MKGEEKEREEREGEKRGKEREEREGRKEGV